MSDLAKTDHPGAWQIKSPAWRGRWGVLWVALIFGAGFMVLWTGSHEISDLRAVRYPLYFDWETRIPFQQWALAIYMPHDAIVILLAIFFRNWREATPYFGTLLVQTAIAVPFFLLVPIEPGYQNAQLTPRPSIRRPVIIAIANVQRSRSESRELSVDGAKGSTGTMQSV